MEKAVFSHGASLHALSWLEHQETRKEKLFDHKISWMFFDMLWCHNQSLRRVFYSGRWAPGQQDWFMSLFSFHTLEAGMFGFCGLTAGGCVAARWPALGVVSLCSTKEVSPCCLVRCEPGTSSCISPKIRHMTKSNRSTPNWSILVTKQSVHVCRVAAHATRASVSVPSFFATSCQFIFTWSSAAHATHNLHSLELSENFSQAEC